MGHADPHLVECIGGVAEPALVRLGHATQEAALRYQHATDERHRVLANGIDRLIQAAREESSAPVVPLRSGVGRSESGRT